MPKVRFLPDSNLCPKGAVIDAKPGDNVCELALKNNIEIEHACELSCACTTCHVFVREGFDDLEEDFLDKAWGVDPDSRLSCQVIVKDTDIVIEIPKYTINMVSEKH